MTHIDRLSCTMSKFPTSSPHLGIEAWNNKVCVHAIDRERFKRWRPEMWNTIKMDYDDVDIDGDNSRGYNRENEGGNGIVNDGDNNSGENRYSMVMGDASTTTTNIEGITAWQTSMTDMLKNIDENIKTLAYKIQESHDKASPTLTGKTLEGLRMLFKCFICLELPSEDFVFCPNCNRFLGCFDCHAGLEKCPNCRGEFMTQLQRARIPGIVEMFQQ